MKKLLLGIAMLGGAAILGGCPIYSDQGPPSGEYQVCPGDSCYSCPDPSYSGACISWPCSQDSDCGEGYVCSDYGQCAPAPPTFDAGDCSENGCPEGYVCKLSNGAASCVVLDAGTGRGDAGVDGATPSEAGIDSGAPSADSGTPSTDSGSLPDVSAPAASCNADTDCSGTGAKCVDGACASQVRLCSDTTQCLVAGSSCVDGLCEATCSATVPCPSGYGCDFTRGVCNLNPGACAGSGASSCQGGAVCVESHCVSPCDATAEGGPGCAAGQVCVNGGCIPDQAATFACVNDGDQALLSNACPDGYTCLHHDCYLACNVDAAPTSADCGPSQSCKNVSIETGTYGVCATAGTLGSDCDPAQGKYCSSGVCINGSCQ